MSETSDSELAATAQRGLREGDFAAAENAFRRLLEKSPGSLLLRSLLGLARRPNSRTQNAVAVARALEPVAGHTVFVGEGLATWQKSPAFIRDARFLALETKNADLAPNGVSNWHWNLQTLLWAAQQAKGVPGDFVELGVYRGHSSLFVAEYVDFGSWPKRWWLYDTFDGVPADQLDEGRSPIGPEMYGPAVTVEELQARFAPFSNFIITKGRVPEVLAETSPDAISFMHIDLNSAAAEIGALDFLYERISPGGIVIFDDFGWAASEAQQRAELEWFCGRGLHLFPLPTGQAVFVKPLK